VSFPFNVEILEYLRKRGITVEKILEGYLHGKHRSPFFGHSMEFKDLRVYEKGDDIKFIDWRLYGRTEKYFVRKFEEETNIRVFIVLDISKSMSIDGKGSMARGLAAIFAFLSYLSRDSFGLFLFNSGEVFFVPPAMTYYNLQNFLKCLDTFDDTGKTDFLNAMLDLEKRVKKRSLIVVISDFLFDLNNVRKFIRFYKSKGNEIMALPVISSRELKELTPGFLLKDAEFGDELVGSKEVVEDYARMLREHYVDLKELFTTYGIKFKEFLTDKDLSVQIREFLEL